MGKINKAQALWTRSKSEVNDDEYKEFYKHIAHDYSDPLTGATTAWKVSRSTPACCISVAGAVGYVEPRS